MPKYGYLVVEGIQDAAFFQKLLEHRGFGIVREVRLLDSYWHPLVPRNFPHDGDLLRRVPVPSFMASDTCDVQIAIHVAGGEKAIAATVEESYASLSPNSLFAIGAILDADVTHSPATRAKTMAETFRKKKIEFAAVPGEITGNAPVTGVFVMPDNSSGGTLERLLILCAEAEYQAALADARTFIGSVEDWNLSPEDGRDFRKSAGRDKAARRFHRERASSRQSDPSFYSRQPVAWLRGIEFARNSKCISFPGKTILAADSDVSPPIAMIPDRPQR